MNETADEANPNPQANEEVDTSEDNETSERSERSKKKSLRRRVLKYTALVVVALLIPVAVSYIRALTGPGYDSMAARTVQWARDHHMGSLVDWAERHWFSQH